MKNSRKRKLFEAKSLLTALFMCLSIVVFAQTKTVTGTVLDDRGESIIGASVTVKGTTNGTMTDVDGKYTISARSQDVLVIKYVGYLEQSVTVGGQSQVNITLKEDTQLLDEVVVVGYGVVKRSDVTGAITTVSEKTIRERPVQNAISAMQGKAAGVDIQTNVRPGESATVEIRGTRSFKGDNNPLYVVDGVILMGTMNDINPSDIASMEILKDASSTAIYGSRGANGVVLITTKTGKKGKVSVEYNNSISIDKVNSLTDWASAGQMLDRVRTAYINGGEYTLGTEVLNSPNLEADINKFGHSDAMTIAALSQAYEGGNYNSSRIPTTDWLGMLTQTGITQNHQIALASATDNSKVYTSLGYYDAKGVQLNQKYKRYTGRINADLSPTKWLTVGTSMNAAFSEQKYGRINLSGSATGARDLYGRALGQYLMATPYDEEGNMIEYPGNNNAAPVYNPFIDVENTDDLVRTLNLQVNAFADVTFTPWLKYRFNLGTGYRTSRDGRWQGSKASNNRQKAKTASASYDNDESFQYLIENILTFNKSFGIHNLGATFVQSAQHYQKEGSALSASKILYDTSKWYNLAANLNGKPDGYSSSFTENSMASYMGRINYGLMDKYLLAASVRYDGASVLAKGHKWDAFPSVSVAWKMQEESFMKNIKWIDETKLRVGYGVTGNSAIDPYTTMGPLAQYNYVYGTTPSIGMVPYNMPNPNLGWEKTAQLNIGVDFAVLNRRLTGTIEYYKSNTTDLLMDRNIPGVTGFVNILDNIGETENNGIELNLSSVNIQTKDFRWTTNFNLSHNKEKIVSLVNGKEDMPDGMGVKGLFIGQPRSTFRYYKVDGLWQNTEEDLAEIAKWKGNGYNFEPGQYKPVEQGEKNYKLEDNDLVLAGNRNPKVVMGLTNTFNYKDWEFSFFVYSRLGQKYYANLTPAGQAGGDYIGYGCKASLNEFWSEDNPGAKYPRLTSRSASVSNANVNRSANVHDGSFVTVRNISLGYSVPSKFLKTLSMSHCQFFMQVLNPFIFGGDVVKAGLNPDDTNSWSEMNSTGDLQGGTNNNTYMTTSFVFGVRLGF